MQRIFWIQKWTNLLQCWRLLFRNWMWMRWRIFIWKLPSWTWVLLFLFEILFFLDFLTLRVSRTLVVVLRAWISIFTSLILWLKLSAEVLSLLTSHFWARYVHSWWLSKSAEIIKIINVLSSKITIYKRKFIKIREWKI